MFSGIAAGFLSVLFMCSSYIFSRTYIRKHENPVKLSIFSQLVMSVGGLILLSGYLCFASIPCNQKFFALLLGQVTTFIWGQTSFFMLLKEVEATRASSLIGLKLIALAVVSTLLGNTLSGLQWLAVLLCTVAAVGMNFSGGRLSLRAVFWLVMAAFGYALCDMCITKMMLLMPGKSMLFNAVGVMGCCFTLLGAAVLPALIKYPLRRNELKDSVLYSLVYLGSMLFLYTCFGLIGVVFGSIIQAGRGIVSIILGMVLLHFGLEKNEPQVAGKIWIRRSIMAVFMLSAMILYTLTVKR